MHFICREIYADQLLFFRPLYTIYTYLLKVIIKYFLRINIKILLIFSYKLRNLIKCKNNFKKFKCYGYFYLMILTKKTIFYSIFNQKINNLNESPSTDKKKCNLMTNEHNKYQLIFFFYKVLLNIFKLINGKKIRLNSHIKRSYSGAGSYDLIKYIVFLSIT